MKTIQLKRFSSVLAAAVLLTAAARSAEIPATGVPATPGAAGSKHRSHLPMPNTVRPGLITYDAKDPDTKFPPIPQLRPPRARPTC